MSTTNKQTRLGVSHLSTDDWDAYKLLAHVPGILEIATQAKLVPAVRKLPIMYTVRAGFWYLTGDEDAVRYERLALLKDYCKSTAALACTISIPPDHLVDDEMSHSILKFREDWNDNHSLPLYFEPGKAGPPQWLDPRHCVYDPLWNPRGAKSDYWKVHGWHNDRWVRIYPETELATLAKTIKRDSPRFVVLGHSQRMIQISTLNHYTSATHASSRASK